MPNKIDGSKLLRWFGVLVGVAMTVTFTVFAVLWVLSLRDPERLQEFQEMLNSLGPGGWFILLGIQYVQIVVAVIPGGPIQIVAGALYGPWVGTATCLLGNLLATATVFYLVSRFGMRIISLFVDPKDLKVYRFLQNEKHVERLVILLFFIPGTPKDALTYIFALTPIRMKRFMLLSTISRIPAILTSVLAGDSIINGEWTKALVMFCIIAGISALGFVLHRWILKIAKGRERRS